MQQPTSESQQLRGRSGPSGLRVQSKLDLSDDQLGSWRAPNVLPPPFRRPLEPWDPPAPRNGQPTGPFQDDDIAQLTNSEIKEAREEAESRNGKVLCLLEVLAPGVDDHAKVNQQKAA